MCVSKNNKAGNDGVKCCSIGLSSKTRSTLGMEGRLFENLEIRKLPRGMRGGLRCF